MQHLLFDGAFGSGESLGETDHAVGESETMNPVPAIIAARSERVGVDWTEEHRQSGQRSRQRRAPEAPVAPCRRRTTCVAFADAKTSTHVYPRALRSTPLNSRSPRPSSTGAMATCSSSMAPSRRYCWIVFAPPPIRTSLPAAASRARSSASRTPPVMKWNVVPPSISSGGRA